MRRATHARAREAWIADAARHLGQIEALERQANAAAEAAIDYHQGLTAVQCDAMEASATGEDLALLWARRTGKTHTLPRILLRSAEEPDTWSVYLTKTRLNAKQLLWRWLKKAARDLGIRYTTNESDLVLERENGGAILLGGANDIGAIERWRQYGWKTALIDEMGVLDGNPDLLATLIDDVIEPATVDHGGQIIYSGTPGYLLGGRWHQLSGDEAPIRVLRADARSNTAVPGIWDRILEIKRKNGWSDDHPTWVREYLGKWVVDAGALVYPYDPARNAIAGLPTHTPGGVVLHSSGWRYGLGCDVGFVHACAFVLVAVHELDPHDYVISAEKHGELLPDGFSAIVASYLERYPGLRVVVDTGGMGKIHAEWTSLRDRLPIQAADKRDKPSSIRDLRGAVLSGRVKILDGPQTAPLRVEMGRLGWDKTRLQHAEGQEDHACDGLLYVRRALRNLTPGYEDRVERSPEDLLEEKLIEQRIAAVSNHGRPWWDA